ncbi:9455_t:CDS:1, partial [Gigaspora margarita]
MVKLFSAITSQVLIEPNELYIDYLEDLVKVKDHMLKHQKQIIKQLSQ